MPRQDVRIPAADGDSAATLHVPEGAGPWPAVLVYVDAAGVRETFRQMGDQFASMGYVTLVPDLYYRSADWAPFDIATLFSDESERARLMTIIRLLTKDKVVADANAYADFLLARPEVSGTAIGTTGYCMGGRLSLIAATGLGDKVAAAASFHGGHLAVPDNPDSPHLAVGEATATLYVACAEEDAGFTAEQAELLRTALAEAGLEHTVEFYPAKHGFAVPDNPTYDEQASARHWEALRHLYLAHLV
jgi:carboxymethylenebutenolidase